MRKHLLYILIAIILFIIGFLSWRYFLSISISQLDNSISVASRKLGDQFISNLIFALSLGILPLLLLTVKKVIKHQFKNLILVSLGLIIGSGILLWQFRIFCLNLSASSLENIMLDNNIIIPMDIKNLYFEVYLLLGFIVGTVLSILIFKRKTKTLKK